MGLLTDLLGDGNGTYAQVFKPEAYGAVGDGMTDDATALQACADAAAAVRGVMVLQSASGYRSSTTITVDAWLHIEGRGYEGGSGVAGAELFFDSAVAIGIDAPASTMPTLRNVRIDGGDSRGGIGLRTGNDGSCSPILENVQFYRWDVGADFTDAYYLFVDNVEVNACGVGLKFTDCYNVNLYRLVNRSTPIAIDVAGPIQGLNIFGGSIEGYGTSGGIIGRGAAAGSQVNLHGVYFESPTTNAIGIDWSAPGAGNETIISLWGCQVRLTDSDCWVDLGSTATHLRTDANKLICPTSSTTTPVAYKVASATGIIELGGDNISGVDKGTYTDAGSIYEQRFIPATRFTPNSGGPSFMASTWQALHYVDGSTMTSTMVLSYDDIPKGWATFAIDIVWAGWAATTGHVYWRIDTRKLDVSDAGGNVVSGGTTATLDLVDAAGSQYQQMVGQIATSQSLRAGQQLSVRLYRLGGNASDTYAGDASFQGLRLRRIT